MPTSRGQITLNSRRIYETGARWRLDRNFGNGCYQKQFVLRVRGANANQLCRNGYQGQSMSCIRLNRAGKNMTDLMCMRLRFSSDGPSGHSNVARRWSWCSVDCCPAHRHRRRHWAPKNRWLAKLVATSNSCSFADRAEAWLPSKKLQMRGGINRESTVPIRPPLTSSKTLATPYSTRSPRPKPAEQTLPHHRCALHASEHGSACRKKLWRGSRRSRYASLASPRSNQKLFSSHDCREETYWPVLAEAVA